MPARTKTVTVGGKEYTLQHPGVRWVIRLNDRALGAIGSSREKWIDEVLEHVVVEPPGLTIDDFDSYAELDELVTAIAAFLRGTD